MKKREMLWAFLLAVLLVGCGVRQQESLADSHESYPYDQTVSGNIGFIATEFATYYICSPEAGESQQRICVCPQQSDTFVPLCAKPNCPHNDWDCNAATQGGLGFYKNRLYTLEHPTNTEDVYDLVSMQPDGSDRRVKTGIPPIKRSDGGWQYPDVWIFHSGKLILLFQPEEDRPYEEQITRVQILDLETKQITEPFAAVLTPDLRISVIIHPVGQYIYSTLEYRQPDGTLEYWRGRMDMESGEIEKLFPIDAPTVGIDESYADETTIYWFEPGEGFYEYDLATGQTVNKGLPVADMNSVKRDADWIYGSCVSGESYEHCTLYFLNHDYEVVDKLELPDNIRLRMLDAEHLFFGDILRQGEDTISAVADRADIGTGKLALRIQREVSAEKHNWTKQTEGTQSTVSADPSFYEESLTPMEDHTAKIRELGAFFYLEEASMLYFIPKGEKAPVPACRKPGCDHTGTDCGAYYCFLVKDEQTGQTSYSASGLHYFRDRMYLFAVEEDNSFSLYSVDPVSFERRLEKNYPLPVPDQPWTDHLITGDFLGDTMLLYHSLASGFDCLYSSGELVDISTLETVGEYAPVKQEDVATVQRPWMRVGDVGFARAARIVKDEKGYEQWEYWLAEINLNTQQVRMVIPTQLVVGTEESRYTVSGAGFTATQDTIYYLLETEDFHEYDRKTGQDVSYPCPRKDVDQAQYADDLILVVCCPGLLDYYDSPENYDFFELRKDEELVLFSRDYRLLDTVKLPREDRYDKGVCAVTAEYIYCHVDSEIYALDRAQIGSGKLEWERVKD